MYVIPGQLSFNFIPCAPLLHTLSYYYTQLSLLSLIISPFFTTQEYVIVLSSSEYSYPAPSSRPQFVTAFRRLQNRVELIARQILQIFQPNRRPRNDFEMSLLRRISANEEQIQSLNQHMSEIYGRQV